jgi:hypothetical protein
MMGIPQQRGHACMNKKSVRVSECFHQNKKIPNDTHNKIKLPISWVIG